LNEKLLIIDDETNVRTMMQLALRHVGYQVETATNGIEGLEKYGNGENFDLVIVDQRMPQMTGIEVQKAIFSRNPKAKFILATAFGTIDLALEAIQAGAQDFLRKPFTAETLRAAVRTTLDREVEHHTAVPVGMVCKSFTRTTFNGYSFSSEEDHLDEKTGEVHCDFRVVGQGQDRIITVSLPAYFQELVKAHADLEQVPGGPRFWQALAEEFLADFLWTNASLPETPKLIIEDLSSPLRNWIDSMLTVDLPSSHARS